MPSSFQIKCLKCCGRGGGTADVEKLSAAAVWMDNEPSGCG